MATANIKKTDHEQEQWETVQTAHQWNESSDDEKDDIDHHEFYDAQDTDFHHQQSSTTETNAEAELLHKRLNAQLSTNEEVKKKSPG